MNWLTLMVHSVLMVWCLATCADATGQGDSYLKRLLFRLPKRRSVARNASVDIFALKAASQFAEFVTHNKKLENGSKYEVLKVYGTDVVNNAGAGLSVISFDVLLRRLLTNKSKAYPLEYLHCGDVEMERRTSTGSFQVKNFLCKDVHVQGGDLDKLIVAQAAKEYARLIYGNRYKVLHVPVVEMHRMGTELTLKLTVEMFKPKKVKKSDYLKLVECTGVLMKYKGNPEHFKPSYVSVKNPGKCMRTFIPSVDKNRL